MKRSFLLLSIPLLLVGAAAALGGKEPERKGEARRSSAGGDARQGNARSDSRKSDSEKRDGRRSDSAKRDSRDSKKGGSKAKGSKARRAESGKGKGTRRQPEPPARDPSLDTEPRVAKNPADPREVRIAEMRGHLDDVLRAHPLSRTRIGVAVMDVRDGDVLYAHNADKLFNPASNTKIVSTAAALSALGSDYRYRTRLLGPAPDGDGVVRGDIELRGSGDPSLSTQGVGELAQALAARGVVRIEGDLIADGKLRDDANPGESLGGGAIIMNRNVYTVRVSPGESGKNAYVTVEPRGDGFLGAVSKVTTTSKKKRKTRITLSAFRDGGRFIVVAKGRINIRDEYRKKARLGDGTTWALVVLQRALGDFGIELTGKTRTGSLATQSRPDGAPPVILVTHVSAPLGEICRVSNKDSNNFVADSIFRTLGRERFGGAVTMEKGQRAVKEILTALGFEPSSYRIINGSGLTHENRIQPSTLARLLRHLYFDLAVAPEFVTSLAIGGIDGTIKGRFRGGDFLGRVRAKTGTLSNVSALSGYVGDHGDVLIFAILVDDFHHRKLEDIRDAQVRLVKQMMAYLRAGRPVVGPRPAESGTGPVVPGEGDEPDDESDSEVDEGAGEAGGN